MSEGDTGRRSWFLVFMAFVVNAFLIAFTADAVLSLVDDAVLRAADGSVVENARLVVSVAVLTLILPALFAAIFVPQIPKLVLLPPLIVFFWQMFGAPPFGWSLTDRSTWLPLNLVQLVAGVASFYAARVTTGGWLLAASRLPRKGHLVLRTLIAIPVSLVLIVGFASAALIGLMVAYFEDQTHGYLNFTWSGVEVRETVMRRGDKTVYLSATVHFADPQFYIQLYRRIPKDALILAEGVTDRENRLKAGLSYAGAAQTLGLETQDVFNTLMGPETDDGPPADKIPPPPTTKGKPTAPQPVESKPVVAPARPHVVRADIDVSDFSSTTITFIGKVGELYASRNFGEIVTRLSALGQGMTDADLKAVMDDLVYKRNNHLLGELDKRLPQYSTVFIPWGAQHMYDIELALKERGFTVVSQRMIPLARYQTIFDAIGRQFRQAQNAAYGLATQTAHQERGAQQHGTDRTG